MEQFEELIEKLKPIYANQIDYYYVEKFAISVLKLLIKLGIKEGEIYRFDERKKRLRQIEAYNTGISFCFYDKTDRYNSYIYDRVPFEDKFVEFTRYNADYFNEQYLENCATAQLFDMEWWSRIYNYLRLEVNSKKQKTCKQAKARRETQKSRQRPILAVFTSISKTKSKTKYKNLHQMQVYSHHMQDFA